MYIWPFEKAEFPEDEAFTLRQNCIGVVLECQQSIRFYIMSVEVKTVKTDAGAYLSVRASAPRWAPTL